VLGPLTRLIPGGVKGQASLQKLQPLAWQLAASRFLHPATSLSEAVKLRAT